MKNYIIIGLLALVFLTPSITHAQTVDQAAINAQLQVILNQLLVQVQELMAKLIEIQNKQIADSQTLQTVVQQQTQSTTTQNFGNVVTPSTPTVSFGTPYCNSGDPEKKEVKVPFTVLGSGWQYGSITLNGMGGVSFEYVGNIPNAVIVAENNTYNLVVKLTNTKPTANNQYQYLDPVFQAIESITSPNCQ